MNELVRLPTIEELNRDHLVFALKYYDGDKSKTARALGITVKTLQNWLNRWGLKEFYHGGKYPGG